MTCCLKNWKIRKWGKCVCCLFYIACVYCAVHTYILVRIWSFILIFLNFKKISKHTIFGGMAFEWFYFQTPGFSFEIQYLSIYFNIKTWWIESWPIFTYTQYTYSIEFRMESMFLSTIHYLINVHTEKHQIGNEAKI